MINYRQLTKDDDNFFKNLIAYEGKYYDDFLSLGWSKNQIINQINKKTNLAFGAFNSSKTKKVKYKASIKLLKKARKITKTPIVAIGGINLNNYKNLLLNKANFLAISGYIWKNKKLKPIEAIKKLL